VVDLSDISAQLTENTITVKAMHGRMDDITVSVKELDGAIRGNGKVGLVTKVAVIETRQKVLWGVFMLLVSGATAAFFGF
tara:strand:- start:1762 stop:2001 length:240 start_codon:yes stop_codon:yes gene_type:complete